MYSAIMHAQMHKSPELASWCLEDPDSSINLPSELVTNKHPRTEGIVPQSPGRAGLAKSYTVFSKSQLEEDSHTNVHKQG